MDIIIRPFADGDWEAVAKIYGQGIETQNATFETEVPTFEQWTKKFHPHLLWTALLDQRVVGWAGLQPVSIRKAYEGVVEVTIYIDLKFTGKGIGKGLMRHLIAESENAGIWTLFASVFPENVASINLHRSAGFREIGYREKIAQINGKWRNTLLFERRSKKIVL
jgi:L-amino acid N-acyltransferase YncA